MIGFDTGFFIKLLDGNLNCIFIWKKVLDKEDSFCSSLTLFELKRLSLKGKITPKATNTLLNSITAVCRIVWIDNENILFLSAKLSHGLGIPAVDSIILAGFVESNVKTIYTTDKHFEMYKKKTIKIINLNKMQ